MNVALPPTTISQTASPSADALRWLARLRWGAVFGQLLAIAVATELTDVALALVPLLSLVAAAAVSNAALEVLLRRGVSGARLTWAVLVLDVLLLTGLLLAAGGSSNPFSIFYLVHVALGGLLLGARGAWLMAFLTAALYGLLFFLPAGPLEAHSMHMHGASSLHLQGMWVAFALGAAFVATFVSGLARALAVRDAELTRMRGRAERSERLAALSTFSANAAHEIGSPLATIAVVAHELERSLGRLPDSAPHVEDAQLIRREVERCRNMVRDLTQRGGLLQGERPEPVSTRALWDAVRSRFGERAHAIVHVDDATAGGREAASGGHGPSLRVPRQALVQALANLAQNGLAASLEAGQPERVEVGATALAGGIVRLWVRDRGAGFSPEVLAELGEAFVTTRPGVGLGLGLYLASSLARELGGRLDVRSSPTGSEVALELPGDPVHADGGRA